MLRKFINHICSLIQKINEKLYLFFLRRRLKNKTVTIVCNNCIGGVIYHNLGLQFTSPTINLSIHGQDYLEFVKHFKYYQSCPLKEMKTDKNYPVGIIVPKDDEHREVVVHFQHYDSFEQACKKWTERYQRVNWNNILFVWEFYDSIYDEKLLHDFDRLDVQKVEITHRHIPNLKNQSVVSCYDNDKPFAKILAYSGLSGKRYLEEVDYVSKINKIIDKA